MPRQKTTIRKKKPDPIERARKSGKPPVEEKDTSVAKRKPKSKPLENKERNRAAGSELGTKPRKPGTFVKGDPRIQLAKNPGRRPIPPDVKEFLKGWTLPALQYYADVLAVCQEELDEARARKEALREWQARNPDEPLPGYLAQPIVIEIDPRMGIVAAEKLLDRAIGKPKEADGSGDTEGVVLIVKKPEGLGELPPPAEPAPIIAEVLE